MARIITETFEGGHLLRFGNVLGLNGATSVVTTASIGMAMDGARCYRSGSFDGSMTMPLPDIAPSSTELYVGFFFITDNPDAFFGSVIGGTGYVLNHRLVSFWAGSLGLCTIKINPQTQILEIFQGGFVYNSPAFTVIGSPSTTFLATCTGQVQPISANTLYHCQVHVKVAGAASLIEVKLDDTLIGSVVCDLGVAPITMLVWHSAGSSYADGGVEQWYDAIVVNDTTTALDNSWTGIRRFLVQNVIGPGTYAEFTPVGDAPNFRCIDDLPNDGDLTYNYALNLGFRDSFPCSPHGLDVAHTTFHAWFQEAIARKTSGTMRINLGVRRAGNDYYSAFNHNLGVSYDVYDHRLATDPSSLVAWTGAGLDATEIIYRSA